MKRLLVSSMVLVALISIAACEGNDGNDAGAPGIELGNQNLGRSAAMCISQSWQGQPDVRRFEWNGNTQESFDVSGGRGSQWNSVRWDLTPASRGHYQMRRAQGQLVVQQGGSQVSVRSALGGFVNLNVANGNSQDDVNLHCVSNAAFRQQSIEQNRISCRVRIDSDRQNYRGRDEVIYWNGRPQARELSHGYDGEFVVLRLKEGGRMELEVRNLNFRKSIRAEAMINEGLEIRYRSRAASSNLMISCGAASK